MLSGVGILVAAVIALAGPPLPEMRMTPADEAVMIEISGYGPTDTAYVDPANAPR
jgi:hypothetical protein